MLRVKSFEDAPLSGKRVLVRADFNVPIQDGRVVDDYRIVVTYKTLDVLRAAGARIVLFSHVSDAKQSLEPVARYLSQRYEVFFRKDIGSRESYDAVASQASGSITFFENIRSNSGEEGNDSSFARMLALYGDIYINEAFAVSHREHASITTLAQLLPAYAGFQVQKEVQELSRAFKPEHPFFAALGGAKTKTKLPLITKLLADVDQLFVGGVLANDILTAQGHDMGEHSVYSKDGLDLTQVSNDPKLFLPKDVYVQRGSRIVEVSIQDIEHTDGVVDTAGTRTYELWKGLVRDAKYVLWNGPFGIYEEGNTAGTLELAHIIAASNAYSIIGGGDTIAAVKELGLMDKFSFVSTGGGAMLDFLAHETLPGLEPLVW